MPPVTTSYEFPASVYEVDDWLAGVIAAQRDLDRSSPDQVHQADQNVARMVAGLAGAGVNLSDPLQRNAFLVGAMSGWQSALGNVPPCCMHASAVLRLLTTPWGWIVARLARRA